MTKIRLLFALVLLILTTPGADAAALTCSGPTPDRECADRELRGLDWAVDVEFDAIMAHVDPLTKLLLRRDQAWFVEIVTTGTIRKYEGADDPRRLRLMDTLTRRLVMLNQLGLLPVAAGPAGTWGNALATVTVRAAGNGGMQVTLTAKLAYEQREDTFTCDLAGTFKNDGSGWFAGDFAAPDAADAGGRGRASARLRLQGNTLRIVRADDTDTDADERVCGGLEIITGSYFALTPAARAAASVIATRTVWPSFKCAAAENSDEEEICADPELAARDVKLARVYAETLRRVEPRLAARLRTDQRGWAKDNPTAYDASLHPAAAKDTSALHHSDLAREELRRRFDERLAMLANLDEKRQGVVGFWEAYNGALTIAPAKDKTDGTMTATGYKWEVGDYKTRCDFVSDGRIEGGVFKAKEAFPTLTRDGAMLITSAEDRDDRPESDKPDYCNRMPSAKARLFPVKPAAGTEGKFDRLR
jgi:uncharacterized protein